MNILLELLEVIAWCALALSMGAVPFWLLHKFIQWREWMAIDPEERAALESIERLERAQAEETQTRLRRQEVER